MTYIMNDIVHCVTNQNKNTDEVHFIIPPTKIIEFDWLMPKH
jgi:hypothetical protein